MKQLKFYRKLMQVGGDRTTSFQITLPREWVRDRGPQQAGGHPAVLPAGQVPPPAPARPLRAVVPGHAPGAGGGLIVAAPEVENPAVAVAPQRERVPAAPAGPNVNLARLQPRAAPVLPAGLAAGDILEVEVLPDISLSVRVVASEQAEATKHESEN